MNPSYINNTLADRLIDAINCYNSKNAYGADEINNLSNTISMTWKYQENLLEKIQNNEILMNDSKLADAYKNSHKLKDLICDMVNTLKNLDDISKLIDYFDQCNMSDFLFHGFPIDMPSGYVIKYSLVHRNLSQDIFANHLFSGIYNNDDCLELQIEIFNCILENRPDLVEYINHNLKTNIYKFMNCINVDLLFYLLDSQYDVNINIDFVKASTSDFIYLNSENFTTYINKIISHININDVAPYIIVRALRSEDRHRAKNLETLSKYIDINYYFDTGIDEITKLVDVSYEDSVAGNDILKICPEISAKNLLILLGMSKGDVDNKN